MCPRNTAGRIPVGLILALVSIACSPSTVTLDRLVADQERFIGDRVIVTGWVVSFEEPDGSVSFVLEDAEQHRVLLLPDNIGERHLGDSVAVTGRFDFDPDQGRILWVEEIHPTPGKPGG